jgi:exosortase D (VPLPA-CTERM-specific)
MIKNEIDIKYWFVPLIILAAGFVHSFWPTIHGLSQQLLNNDDFSHGLIILPVSLYIVWEKRKEIAAVDIRTDWRALSLLLFSVCLFAIGELGAELFTTRVSLILMLISAIWLLYGFELVKVIRFPLIYLFFMLPLPGFIYRNITFPLQLLSSTWAVEILQSLGITAYREGNVIDMGFSQFQVVEACNGLRFILPLFSLGVLFAFWWSKDKVLWKRLLLIFASIPIAILSNVIRIAGTGIISMYWGVEAAQGFFHDFSGWVVFMLCFGLYALLNVLLGVLPGKVKPRRDTKRKGREDNGSRPFRRLQWQSVLAAVGLIVLAPIAVSHTGSVPPKPLKKPLVHFPLQYENWKGQVTTMDELIWERVGGQDYVQVNYEKNGTVPVNFYTAYYEYQRKAGDFIHSPKLCLPGGGWFIEENHVRKLNVEDVKDVYGGKIAFNELVISKDNHRQLVYYWYQGRGRNFTSEYLAKFYMIWDGIFRRRTDGALVRLVRPISPEETVSDARQILDEFVRFTSSELETYFPS